MTGQRRPQPLLAHHGCVPRNLIRQRIGRICRGIKRCDTQRAWNMRWSNSIGRAGKSSSPNSALGRHPAIFSFVANAGMTPRLLSALRIRMIRQTSAHVCPPTGLELAAEAPNGMISSCPNSNRTWGMSRGRPDLYSTMRLRLNPSRPPSEYHESSVATASQCMSCSRARRSSKDTPVCHCTPEERNTGTVNSQPYARRHSARLPRSPTWVREDLKTAGVGRLNGFARYRHVTPSAR